MIREENRLLKKDRQVSLEDMYNGTVKKLALQKNVICAACTGTGGTKEGAVERCTTCRGSGIQVRLQQIAPGMVQQIQSVCGECRGQGERINPKFLCRECNGRKVNKERKILEVHIDKGMKDEQQIRFSGEGDQEPGLEPGDILIVLDEKPHNKYKRHGNDLSMEMDINITEALCGFTKTIETLDNRVLVISSPAGKVVKNDDVRSIHGEGMPQYKNPFTKGQLIVKFNVTFPEDGFLPTNKLKLLEKCLPERSQVAYPDHAEEVELSDYDPERAHRQARREHHGHRGFGHGHGHQGFAQQMMYDSDDDDEMMGGQGGQRVNCANQ